MCGNVSVILSHSQESMTTDILVCSVCITKLRFNYVSVSVEVKFY